MTDLLSFLFGGSEMSVFELIFTLGVGLLVVDACISAVFRALFRR